MQETVELTQEQRQILKKNLIRGSLKELCRKGALPEKQLQELLSAERGA